MSKHIPTFCEWLRGHIGSNWVIARRTKNIVERYGNDVVTLSSKQHDALQDEYEVETGLDISGGPSQAVIDRAVNCHDDLVAALNAIANPSITEDTDFVELAALWTATARIALKKAA